MAIKAAFFDIDGTLISLSNKVVTESTANAVCQLHDKGIKTFVATGRSRPEIEAQDMLRGMIFDGVLANNGQQCYCKDGDLRSIPLSEEDVAALVRDVDAHGYCAWFTERDRLYINRVNARVRQVMADIHTQIPPIEDIHRALSNPVYKVVVYLTPEEVAQWPARVVRSSVPMVFHPLSSDFAPRSGGKIAAMKELLDRFGILPEETIAFGDGPNDAEMLRLAGIGVAMGNGSVEAKEAADYITDTCENDGIRKALEHFGLI